MIDPKKIKQLTGQIEDLLASGDYSPIQSEVIKQKYIEGNQALDVRRLSREFKMPMKHVKREIEKTDRKVFNALKPYL